MQSKLSNMVSRLIIRAFGALENVSILLVFHHGSFKVYFFRHLNSDMILHMMLQNASIKDSKTHFTYVIAIRMLPKVMILPFFSRKKPDRAMFALEYSFGQMVDLFVM